MSITLTQDQALQLYDESINDDRTVQIGEVEFERAKILHDLDPVAYWAGFSDFVDTLDNAVEGYTDVE